MLFLVPLVSRTMRLRRLMRRQPKRVLCSPQATGGSAGSGWILVRLGARTLFDGPLPGPTTGSPRWRKRSAAGEILRPAAPTRDAAYIRHMRHAAIQSRFPNLGSFRVPGPGPLPECLVEVEPAPPRCQV